MLCQKFTVKSAAERTLKIGYYLAELEAEIEWRLSSRTRFMCVSWTVLELSVESRTFFIPYVCLAPPLSTSPLDFDQDHWHPENESAWAAKRVLWLMTRLFFWQKNRRVTGAEGYIDRHGAIAQTALYIALRGKITKMISNHDNCQIIIRLEVRLQPNIGNTIRPVLMVFTRSGIAPPKVNWFGWNLEHSEYIAWDSQWQILGAICTVAGTGQPGEVLFLPGR